MIPDNIEQLSEFEVAKLLRELENHEKSIIKTRFGLLGNEKKTLQEVGDSLGLPVESVRKIEIQAMIKLGWIEVIE